MALLWLSLSRVSAYGASDEPLEDPVARARVQSEQSSCRGGHGHILQDG